MFSVVDVHKQDLQKQRAYTQYQMFNTDKLQKSLWFQ